MISLCYGVTNIYCIPASGKKLALYRDWLVVLTHCMQEARHHQIGTCASPRVTFLFRRERGPELSRRSESRCAATNPEIYFAVRFRAQTSTPRA
jgi:hypothetical protein